MRTNVLARRAFNEERLVKPRDAITVAKKLLRVNTNFIFLTNRQKNAKVFASSSRAKQPDPKGRREWKTLRDASKFSASEPPINLFLLEDSLSQMEKVV